VLCSCFVYLAHCLPIYTSRLSPDSPALGLVVLVQQYARLSRSGPCRVCRTPTRPALHIETQQPSADIGAPPETLTRLYDLVVPECPPRHRSADHGEVTTWKELDITQEGAKMYLEWLKDSSSVYPIPYHELVQNPYWKMLACYRVSVPTLNGAARLVEYVILQS